MLRILNISYTLKHIPNISFHFNNTLHPYQVRTSFEPRSYLSHFLTNIILTNSQKPVSSFFMVKTLLFVHLRNVNFPNGDFGDICYYKNSSKDRFFLLNKKDINIIFKQTKDKYDVAEKKSG